ncbi:E3 SUMO-protein ligase ZBED1-like [Anastrepha ludens]|uniref:E3 SUMO-protein ligase ZBED1-like n=1 Tax=Anastrepha ludens TaxID=28586 RepID=UPI0023B084CA|nr:E3 SUMO-protein ligase ZBED1-like [Anastrepha ludens]
MDRFIQRGKRRGSTPVCDCTSSDSEKDVVSEKQTQKIKNKISEVWKYFKRSDDKKFAKCLNCAKEYKTSGNTSNLRDHLKRFHPDLKDHAPDSSTTATLADNDNTASTSSSCRSSMRSMDSYLKRAVFYDANSKRKNDIDRALTEMIAKDVQPYSVIENEGFIKYTQVLDPRYKLPSRTQLRDVLMHNLFRETSVKLSAMLESISNIAVTCDLWTSSANVNFITVTCHFLHEYTMKTASLATRKLIDPTNHSAQNIANTLREILNFWNVYEKTICIVTDNASAMLKACELLNIRNLPCFAHTLNLVVQDGLKLDKDEASKALFTKYKFAYTLLQEMPTRWNSFYYMIQRILATHEAIATVLLSTKHAPLPFTAEEINILKDIEKILSFFHQISERICGGTYVTISLIIPLTYGLYRKILSLSPQLQTQEGETMKNILLESISKRLSTYEERIVTRIATIIDPRFKRDGFQQIVNAEEAEKLLENELVNCTSEEIPINADLDLSTKTQDSFLDFLDHRANDKRGNARSNAIIVKRQYLERALAPQDMDPLLWIKVKLNN